VNVIQGDFMIGVVLWNDPGTGKAVFWCEDHGDLAYFEPEIPTPERDHALSAGDMIHFDVSPHADHRRAYNPRLVRSRACKGIQRHLRQAAEESTRLKCAAEAAQVIALNQNAHPGTEPKVSVSASL
jgi:hypothetical protein